MSAEFRDGVLPMPKSVSALAKNALAAGKGAMEEVRIHVFEDDEEAHDEEAVEKLHADFAKQFDKAVATLSKVYGKPTRTGERNITPSRSTASSASRSGRSANWNSTSPPPTRTPKYRSS